MLEKIEITQRFNFKKLNKHYECFIIDLVNKKAYFNISEMIYPDQFFEKNYFLNNSFDSILNDLRSRISHTFYELEDGSVDYFRREFDKLNLFEGFGSEKYLYFEKLENIYSCNVNFYYSDNYQEFYIKNDFPKRWLDFNDLLKELVKFDVLNISHLKNIVTNLFYDICDDGVYDRLGNKLQLTSLEFGHYMTPPGESPHHNFIIDIEDRKIDGYLEKDNVDLDCLYGLLEKYGVYKWILKSYHNKSINHDSAIFDGYDWYLELVFNKSIIWTILGHDEYPDTYLCLAYEVREITDLDLLEIESICDGDIELFNYYGKEKLSKN